jgi:hypothetical protein
LLGRVRKWTAIGRPLQAVSELSMMLWEKARGRAPVRLVSMAGHVRLVLCLLQALEELHALGRRLLCRLAVRIRFGLHTNGPLSASLHALAPLCPRASSARAWCCGRWRGRRGVVNGLLVDTQGVARSRRSPASLQHHSHLAPIPHRRCTQHPTLLGAARTGTFWRFAGRPSPSPTAALAALRLAALSILAVSRSRTVSKLVPMIVGQMQVRCRCAVCCECACRRVRVDVEPRPKPSPHHASANQFATINSSVVWQIATMRCNFFSSRNTRDTRLYTLL